jgi:hypothetical protein
MSLVKFPVATMRGSRQNNASSAVPEKKVVHATVLPVCRMPWSLQVALQFVSSSNFR